MIKAICQTLTVSYGWKYVYVETICWLTSSLINTEILKAESVALSSVLTVNTLGVSCKWKYVHIEDVVLLTISGTHWGSLTGESMYISKVLYY